jgi:hypothetical protein
MVIRAEARRVEPLATGVIHVRKPLWFSSACGGSFRRTFLGKNAEHEKSLFPCEKWVLDSVGNEIIGAQHCS